MEGNRFSFLAERTAPGINSRLTFLAALALAEERSATIARGTKGGAGYKGGGRSLPRHSIYRKDGDIMQSMGMRHATHMHTKSFLEETSATGGTEGLRATRACSVCHVRDMGGGEFATGVVKGTIY